MKSWSEKIDRMAIRCNGEVYSFPRPATHSNILALMVNAYGFKPPVKGKQGYLTISGRFIPCDALARLPKCAFDDHFILHEGALRFR